MFPTFISILDIQSWWEVPCIAHFCSLFRSAFDLLDFDIEDLEEALLTDGTEESSWLQELIVRLLKGCLPNNEISTFNYQMFLRRLFRQKCQEHDRYNPFNTDIDFQLLPLRTKVDILHALCDFRLDADDVLEQLKNLEADSLRVEPLGFDNNDSAYWYFYGTRLYREDFKSKSNKKGESIWQVICFTEEDWFQLAKKFKKSQLKGERQLYRTLTENFLPELPRLFQEKERLARKRLLENQPRRTSNRLGNKRKQEEEDKKKVKCKPKVDKEKESEEEKKRKRELEKRRREAYERRAQLKKHSDDSQSEHSESRYEMAGTKTRDKKSKLWQRKNSESSSGSKDHGSGVISRNTKKIAKAASLLASTAVGRQTNNSLAAATGEIVIQSVANSHRKKLKTSQVFRQTDEDLQTGMHKILDYVKNHDDAWPFVDPVEEEYAPNYYSVILKPMDLQRMEDRLDSGDYKNFARFRSDFQLIVDNCRLYNGVDNEYTEMVANLLQAFEKGTERYLDQISSSDEEIAVEFSNAEIDSKSSKKKKIESIASVSKRKPTLAAQTDKKRERSVSEESVSKKSDSVNSFDRLKSDKKPSKVIVKKQTKSDNIKQNDAKKKSKKDLPGRNRREHLKTTTGRSRSISRSVSRGRWSSSPPPSSPPSSPDSRFDFSPKKNNKSSHASDDEKLSKHKSVGKQKQKSDKWKGIIKDDRDKTHFKDKCKDRSPSPVKQHKDKHTKLRETIEKLKAKSEISNKLKDKEVDKEDTAVLNDSKHKKKDNQKTKHKEKAVKKRNVDLDDGNSTADSFHSENKKLPKKNCNIKSHKKENAAIEALTLATEQTLKDINKWLDDTPRLSEFSSASNSPSHFIGAEEFDNVGIKIDQDYRKRLERPRKDNFGKDIKRRPFHRDPIKFIRKREIQRTIDRLQPGKSKGNLLSNMQNSNKSDDIFPLGPLSKAKDTKNSLIVKTDDSAPKLSLGSVLDSFGKHKFIDDTKKEGELDETVKVKDKSETLVKEKDKDTLGSVKKEEESAKSDVLDLKKDVSPGKATPNLSAWFKAFGTPKVQPTQKKTETKAEVKDEKTEDKLQEQKVKEEIKNVTLPDPSPNPDSPVTPHGHPAPRQRKISTGSSMSERSSFSQDMDSPRVGIDERLGAYPAPYPSPLHRSPSGASPVLVSPRPDVSPKSATYATINGQMRVGFYQDTVSTKSSPDKSCSPRDNPQSPYAQYSEHVYTPPVTQNSSYNYNPSYYPHTQNYSSTSPSSPYTQESNNPPSYYDTSKPLTDQYQAKTMPNYHTASAPVPIPSPVVPQNVDTFHQTTKLPDKQQSTMFPVKKRAYNESDPSQNSMNRYEDQRNTQQQQDQQTIYNSNMEIGIPHSNRDTPKQYVHQNIPQPRPSSAQNQTEPYPKANLTANLSQGTAERDPAQQFNPENLNNSYRNINYSSYNFNSDYPLNIPSGRPLDLNARAEPERNIPNKYGNISYTGSEMDYDRNPQYTRINLNYGRSGGMTSGKQNEMQNLPGDLPLRYSNLNSAPMNYKDMSAIPNSIQQVSHVTSSANSNVLQNVRPDTVESRLGQSLDVSNNYKSPSNLTMDQSLGLRGNLTNLSHIVDRYQSDERMLSGLQTSNSSYYSDKNLLNKPLATSSTNLPIFNQPNISLPFPEMQTTPSSMYSRQITNLQNAAISSQQVRVSDLSQEQLQQPEKKTKRRKNSKTSPASVDTISSPSNQGFQSYAGLKNTSAMESSSISLKTASVVPGSAFNFGPAPPGISLGSGLYGDKDAYPNFLDDYRSPNYYMAAAAAAAHRSTPETPVDKQSRTAHQSSTAPNSAYSFIGAPQARPPGYPLGGHFMPPHQGPPLMDTGSSLYPQYLQAGVLHQGLLGPPGAYPPGYHPALSMRQPFDSMTRPPWL